MDTLETVIVGERANRPGDGRVRLAGVRHWAWQVRAGAFSDLRSQAKLARLGLAETPSLNLLLPAIQEVPWDADAAREVAENWRRQLSRFCWVFLAGSRVARAFGLRLPRLSDAYGLPLANGELRVIVIPHPSGLNHFWNDAGRVDRLSETLRRSLHG